MTCFENLCPKCGSQITIVELTTGQSVYYEGNRVHKCSKENVVETYLIQQVHTRGGEIRKLKWIGRSHAPDRFIALNGVWLVEWKRPGEKERPGQKRERERLEKQGVRCRVVSTKAEVDRFIEEVMG